VKIREYRWLRLSWVGYGFIWTLQGGRFGGRETIEEGDVTRPLLLSMCAWKEECEAKRYKSVDGR
jgi:hypothetical protein